MMGLVVRQVEYRGRDPMREALRDDPFQQLLPPIEAPSTWYSAECYVDGELYQGDVLPCPLAASAAALREAFFWRRRREMTA